MSTSNANAKVARIRWIGRGFILLGALVALGGLIWFVRTATFVVRASKASGEIVEMERVRADDHGATYYPVFKFTDASGTTRTVRHSAGFADFGFEPGEKIDVLYDRAAPEYASISSFRTLWAGPFQVTGFGLLFGAFASAWLFVAARSTRLEDQKKGAAARAESRDAGAPRSAASRSESPVAGLTDSSDAAGLNTSDPERFVERFLAKGFKIIGTVLAGIGLIWLLGTASFVMGASKAPGTIVRVERGTSTDGGSLLYPVFTFTDSAGITHTQREGRGSSHYDFEPGQKIEVLYDGKEPKDSRIDAFQTVWAWPLILIGFGVLMLSFTTLCLSLAARARRVRTAKSAA